MITADTPAQFEALALTIAGVSAPDPNLDAQYLALIAPVMLAIDGRTMETGFHYTLNFTCASKGRPRHWYMQYLSEHSPNNPAVAWGKLPAECGLVYVPLVAAGFSGGVDSSGYTLATVMCASVLKAWAAIIRMWLAGNYPLAINPPPG